MVVNIVRRENPPSFRHKQMDLSISCDKNTFVHELLCPFICKTMRHVSKYQNVMILIQLHTNFIILILSHSRIKAGHSNYVTQKCLASKKANVLLTFRLFLFFLFKNMKIFTKYSLGTSACFLSFVLIQLSKISGVGMIPTGQHRLIGNSSEETPSSDVFDVSDRVNTTPHLYSLISRRRRSQRTAQPQNGSPATRRDRVQDRSLCSWRNVPDYDVTRIPYYMPRAECDGSCNISFLGDSLDGCRLCILFLMRTECAIVYESKEIQRCDQDSLTCHTERVQWPVACTCALKRIRSISTQVTNRSSGLL